MGWVKLDDGFPDHPKMLRVGDRAFRFHILALCWSSRQLTDGFIPASYGGRPNDLLELTEAGLLEPVDGGYQIHDYLDYNPSRERVLSDRAAARERSAKAAERSAEVRANSRGSSGEVRGNFGAPDPAPARPLTPTPTSKTLVQARPERFSEWWAAFPRKQGKIAARKAYQRALKVVDADVLLAAAVRFRDDPNRDEEYTAMPATWLNQGRWEDAAQPSRNGHRYETPAGEFIRRSREQQAREELGG